MEKTEIKRINSSAVEAVLHFLPTEENWGSEVSCAVEHDTLLRPRVESLTVHGKDLKRNRHLVVAAALLCALLGAGTMLLYVHRYRQKRHPKLRNIAPSADGSFSLNVDHFYPGKISVTWEIFQPPSSEIPQTLQCTDLMEENQDGTFNVISTTESLRGKVDESQEYSLRAAVTHQKLKHPSYREWTNQDKDRTRFVSPPELGEILAPVLVLGSAAQLQCTISHYYPDRLTVTWIKNVKDQEEVIEAGEKYKITPQRTEEQRDKTYTCTAGLTLSTSLEDQGSEIICRVTHPGLERPAERSTGPLQVRVKPTSDRPMQLSITDSGDVTAALSLLNFYPKDIMITWSYGRSPEKEPSEETVTGNPDGTFSMITKCNIPGEIFAQTDGKIRVTWKHKAMDKAESREMCVGHEDYPWCPRIVEMSPLILQMDKLTTVTCKISKFFPNNLSVTWYKNVGGSVITCDSGKYEMTCKLETSRDNSYSCSASLSFTATLQHEDLEFLCKVSHPSLKDPIERSTGRALMRVIPEMEKPVKFTLRDADSVRCRMKLKRFYPSDAKITWTYRGDKPIPSTRKRIQTDGEQTYEATSECEVPWDYFTTGVRVTWAHESLTSPQHQDLHLQDFPWLPVIEEIEKPVFLVNTEAILQCKISQYFPNNLTVTWYKKKRNPDVIEKTTPIADRQPDSTYSCTASLTVTPSIEDDGAEFICRVQHPSLEHHIQQTTGPIQVYASPRMQYPIQWCLRQRGEGLCTLYLQSFYPKLIEISWSGSANSSVESRETYEDNTDATYNVRSECRVVQQNISDPDFRISVTWSHKSLRKPEKREVYIKDAGLPGYPTVSEIFTPTMIQNKSAKLHCDIRGQFSDNPSVSWYVKEKGSHGYTPAEERKNRYKTELQKKQRSDSEHYMASLLIHSLQGHHHGVWFMCKVEHSGLEAPIERSAGPLLIALMPQMEKLVTFVLSEPNKVRCCVRLKKFYPSDIEITWTYRGDKPIPSTRKRIQTDGEQTYEATSECEVPWDYFTSGVRVTWAHESLTSPQHRDLCVKDFPWRPVIEKIVRPDLFVNTEAILQCKISEYFPNNLTVTWYKKKRGNRNLPLLGKIIPTADRQPDSTYSCTASLTVTPSKNDDGSEFICRAQHPSLEHHIQQTTGPIQVCASPTLQGPIQWSLGPGGDVLCALSLQNFYPKPLDIRWSSSADSSAGSKNIYSYEADNDKVSTYNVRSECSVAQQNILHPDFRISVTWSHKSLGKPETREVSIKDAGLPWHPTISEIFTSIMKVNEDVTLHCDISGYFPQKLTVSWDVKERGRKDYIPVDRNTYHTNMTPDQLSDTGYRSTASLHFRPSLHRHHGVCFMCKVTHLSLEAPIERRAGPLLIALPPERTEPPTVTPCGADKVLCSVKIRKFFPKKIIVNWIQGERCVMASKTILQVNEEEEEAYDAISECTIPWKELRFPLRVTWKHEAMEEPQSFQLKDAAFLWRPTLSDIDLPVLTDETEAELQCRISGYFPNAVTVSWYKKEKGRMESVHGNDKYKPSVTESQAQPDSTFSCTARLLFTPTPRDQESEIICRVEHPSLERPLESSCGPLHVRGLLRCPTLSDIELPVLTDETEAALQCRISGYCPDAVTVSWYKKEKGRMESVDGNDKYKPSVTESQAQPDSTFSCTARLLFTPTLSDKESEIICRVEHPSLERPLERSSGPLRVRVPPGSSEGPEIISHGKDEVRCSVKIRRFFPKYINVNWMKGERCVMASKTIIQSNNDEEEAYDAISECAIPWKELRSPLWVTWEHEAMEKPQCFQLKDIGILRRPTLSDIDLPVLTDETEAELQCRISGYFPDAVTVSWYKKEKGRMESVHGNDKYTPSVTESQAQPDSTFSCTARLLFTPTLRDQDSEIICRVGHPSLERPLERSSGPLRLQGKDHPQELWKYEDSIHGITLEDNGYGPRNHHLRQYDV